MSTFEELVPDPADPAFQTPWPKPTDDLLAEDEDWWNVACIGYSSDDWLGYAAGYWRAAEVIADHVGRTGHDQDTLVFPFLMCWRHHVEVQLKTLIVFFRGISKRRASFPTPTSWISYGRRCAVCSKRPNMETLRISLTPSACCAS